MKKPKRTPARCQRWGKAGGHARAAKLTPERRREIARLGALSRWGKGKSDVH